MSDPLLPDQIAARLRRAILRGTLPPGSSIKERDNAAELGVSRTPLREAVRVLANEGLVILRPSRTPVVASPTYEELADYVEVLLALERLGGELACARITSDELDRLTALHDRLADSYDKIDPLDLFELDMEFHSMIVRASHNQVLVDTHLAMLQRLWRVRYLSARQKRNRERVVSNHAAIVEALAARDHAAFSVALDTHLGQLAPDMRAALEAEKAPA